MQGYQMPLAIALAVGIAATAYAQETPQVLKLPDQIEWKAPPMVGGASTAVLYGDPTFGLPTVTRMGRDPRLRGSVALAALPAR